MPSVFTAGMLISAPQQAYIYAGHSDKQSCAIYQMVTAPMACSLPVCIPFTVYRCSEPLLCLLQATAMSATLWGCQ